MKRAHFNPAKAFMLTALLCLPASLLAAVPSMQAGQSAREPDAERLVEVRRERIERAAANDQSQPVDWTCGNPSESPPPDDGPVNSGALCDGSMIQVVNVPEGSEIQITKSSPTVMVTMPGPVNYEYFVNNSGSTNLSGIELADDHVDAPPACPQTNLLQGQSMTCTATYTVTPQDIANMGSPMIGSGVLENNVGVFTNEAVTAMDSLQIPIMAAPASVSLVKSSPVSGVSAPGPVNYNYLITNDGGVPLTGVELSDDHTDGNPSCPTMNLAIGQSMSCTATYTVTMADINNGGSPVPGSGFLTNNASVTASPGAAASDTLQIPIMPPSGSMTMDKDSSTFVVSEPGPVNYTYFVVNTGTVPLSGFELDDNHVDAPPFCPQFTLNPGQSQTCTATYTVTQADIDNMGSPVAGSGFLTNSASIVAVEGPMAGDTHQIPIIQDETGNPLLLLPQGSSIGTVPAGEPYGFAFNTVGGVPPIMFTGSGAPSGLSFSQDGNTFMLSGTPLDPGQFIITVSATDSAADPNTASRIYSLQVEGEAPPEPPVMPTLPDIDLPDAVENRPYEIMLEITGGTPPFDFGVEGLPAGLELSLDGSVLTLAGTAAEAGDFVVEISVSDSADPVQEDTRSYDLRVIPALRLLPDDPDLGFTQVNESFQVGFSTTGGLAPVAIEGQNAPPGLQFEMAGGQLVLSGTPTTTGDFEFTVSATDSVAPPQVVSRDYSLSVVLALDIQPGALHDGFVGEEYLAVISVLNGVPPYALEVNGLPAGLALNGNAVAGTPGQAGSFVLTTLASDARGNTGTRDISLEIRAAGDVMVGETLPDAYLDTPYGYQLMAEGASAPVTWSGGGGLPPGFVLESTGLVNGLAQQTGPFSFSATANAADGSVFSGNFNVTVLDPDLVTANAAFPPGQAGVPYMAPTAIRGGSEPYSCVITDGVLPPGLDLNGCNVGIDGTPAQPGSFPFTLGIMDSGSPGLAAEIDGIIQIAETTPLPDPLPPDLDFLPPLNVPVAELSSEGPDTGYPDETLQGLAVDAWGNRYVVGFSFNGSDYDIRVLKLSADGALLWDQVYDSGDHDYGYGIAVSAFDQAVYASGYSLIGNQYQAVLIRYDLVGVEQWAVNHPSGSQVTAYYGLATENAGVYAIGERYNGSNFDTIIVKYRPDGSVRWEQIRSTQTSRTGYAVRRTSCGESPCVLIGGAEGLDDGITNRSGWVERLSPASGSASPVATTASAPVYAIQPTESGFVTAGNSDSGGWFINAFFNGGQSQWNLSPASGASLRGLTRDRNGYLYAAGSGNAGADGMVVLISAEGEALDTIFYDNGASEVFRGVAVSPNGVITTAGERSNATGNRFLVVDFNTGKSN